MLNLLFNIFIIIITLLFLIGFHEWGHCWVAQKLGIDVERFAIGFGKVIFSKITKNNTEYALCAFPFGGYVKFKNQAQFDQTPIYKRALVILAGPGFNLLFAFLAYWLVFTHGITQTIPETINHKEIIAVDNHPTQTWTAVIFRLVPHLGKTDDIKISYKNSVDTINSNKLALPDILKSIDITPSKTAPQRLRQYSPLESTWMSLREINLYFYLNIIIIGKMLTGVISLQTLMGPLGLFATTLYAAHQGFIIFTAFLGFLSVSLAFANLLPIPGLDGSHIVYLFIELIRKKPLSLRVQMLLFRLGIVLLCVVMFQALINDLGRLL